MTPAYVADVGNTRVKWGRVADNAVADSVALAPDPAAWQAQHERWQVRRGSNWRIAGVHPERRDELAAWLRETGDVVDVVDSYWRLPLRVLVDAPERVGIDRLLNAVAINTVRAGSACMIVAAGTAITVDYVDTTGAFRGGAILPGLRLMARALHQHTALLPDVEIGPEAVPAKSTESAIRAGVFHAVLGGIDRLHGEYAALETADLMLYFTGGDAELLASGYGTAHTVWPALTLAGLLHCREASGDA